MYSIGTSKYLESNDGQMYYLKIVLKIGPIYFYITTIAEKGRTVEEEYYNDPAD